jgi:hypothetical protein
MVQFNGQPIEREPVDETEVAQTEYQPTGTFNAKPFQGTVSVCLNAPQAEMLADLILQNDKRNVKPTVWAFGCAMRNAAKEVREFLAGARTIKKD